MASHDTYGILDRPNIRRVVFGEHVVEPWYGNAAYFGADRSVLGVDADPKDRTWPDRKDRPTRPADQSDVWLDTLHVCEFCFKYTADGGAMAAHRQGCARRTPTPTAGRLVYRDDDAGYVIREVRGFKEPLLCQNLCLFGKLFLDDKSVYYNVDQFDFYILYGPESAGSAGSQANGAYRAAGRDTTTDLVPMGFFSKEVVSWDNDNNLACICVFPPFQRRGLGSLLIEFSYAAARHTPGQYFSGPEFPLSPYGQASYLNFWARQLAPLLVGPRAFSLKQVAVETGFRKDDILLTLEYMEVLFEKNGAVSLHTDTLRQWCAARGVSVDRRPAVLRDDCLLI